METKDTCGKSASETQKNFWDTRSKSFPGHRDGEDTYQAKMLDIMKKHGIDFKGKTVLDLGCGTGSYTIHMARGATHVTALDISDGMLNTLAASARENGLSNVECIRADWSEYIPEKKFDIILCSLTPAVKDAQAVEKIYNCAAQWVINIYFAAPMKAYVLDGLFDLHGLDHTRHAWDPIMKDWLTEKGIAFTPYRVQGEWATVRTREEMIANCVDVLEAHKTTPKLDEISKYIEYFKDDGTGLYMSKTAYDVEMIIWEK